MGLTVVLEDENGDTIQTLQKEFNYIELESIAISDYQILKYIDFYGDTVFNCLQLEDLTKDLEKLKSSGSKQQQIIDEILSLIKMSQQRTHTYLKFYGD